MSKKKENFRLVRDLTKRTKAKTIKKHQKLTSELPRPKLLKKTRKKRLVRTKKSNRKVKEKKWEC
jgi:hypothetical protein